MAGERERVMTGAFGEDLRFLYGRRDAKRAERRLEKLLAGYSKSLRPPPSAPDSRRPSLTEKDALLITYADHLRSQDVPPLASLRSILENELAGCFSGVHILPFFPSSSDDGFSVMDHRLVDPGLGSWSDLSSIGHGHRLMVDLVLNHSSSQGAWFRGFLQGDRRFSGYFIVTREGADLRGVFRPRTQPLVTAFDTPHGRRLVWTTFSADQIDLNYRSPEVLLEMLDILLTYVVHGAQIIRLDAVAFLWKEPGTPCVHLPQTHAVIRILRAVVDEICPWVLLVSETNVPHDLNVTYLGKGDEAHMVYDFTLPPLLLDAFRRGDAGTLSAWAESEQSPSGPNFLNFLASHDGIGVLPARGFLTDDQFTGLADLATERGGFVSLRTELQDGRMVETPYELNIPWHSAVSDPAEDLESRVRKLLTSQCAMLCLAGVPAIYINTLFSTPPDRQTALRSGSPRAINRAKLSLEEVREVIFKGEGFAARVFRGLQRCLSVRRANPAFDPAGAQQVRTHGSGLFTVLRTSPDGRSRVLCVHNVSGFDTTIACDAASIRARPGQPLTDILSGETLQPQRSDADVVVLRVAGHGAIWVSAGTQFTGTRNRANRSGDSL